MHNFFMVTWNKSVSLLKSSVSTADSQIKIDQMNVPIRSFIYVANWII